MPRIKSFKTTPCHPMGNVNLEIMNGTVKKLKTR